MSIQLDHYQYDTNSGDEVSEAPPHEWTGVWASVFGVTPGSLQPEPVPDPLAKVPRMTAKELTRILTAFYTRRNHPIQESWVVFSELMGGTRYSHRQRIDLWAMCVWQSKGMERISYEIKVSRSDLLQELKNPWKRGYALEVSNRFYFATPPGLMRLDELPAEAGLVEVYPDGKVHFRRGAPRRELPRHFSMQFAASVMRRAFRSMLAVESTPQEVTQ